MTVTLQTIRDAIGRHIQEAYSGTLPLEWENMPPPENLSAGWVRLLVSIDRLEKAGLNPGTVLTRGRIRLLIAVAQGQGTATMDQVVAELVHLLASQDIAGIRTSAAVFAAPKKEKGLHLLPVEIRLTAVETDIVSIETSS